MKVDHKYFFMDSWSVASAADVSGGGNFSGLKGSPTITVHKWKETPISRSGNFVLRDDTRDDFNVNHNSLDFIVNRNSESLNAKHTPGGFNVKHASDEFNVNHASGDFNVNHVSGDFNVNHVYGDLNANHTSCDGVMTPNDQRTVPEDGSESGDSCASHLVGNITKHRGKLRFATPKDETLDSSCLPGSTHQEESQSKNLEDNKEETNETLSSFVEVKDDQGSDGKARPRVKKFKKKKQKKVRSKSIDSLSTVGNSDTNNDDRSESIETNADTLGSFVSCMDSADKILREKQNRSHVRQIRNLLKRNPNLPIKDEWWQGIGAENLTTEERKGEQYDIMLQYYSQQHGSRPYRQYREKHKNKYTKKKPSPIATQQAQAGAVPGSGSVVPEIKRHEIIDQSKMKQFNERKLSKIDEKRANEPSNNVVAKAKRLNKKAQSKSDRLMSNPALLAAALVLKAPLPGGPNEGPQDFSEAAQSKMKVPVLGVSKLSKEKQIGSYASIGNVCDDGERHKPTWMCCSM
mmetsp:Transcript_14284/g.31278  ORF Transcript_14284/g.31278 Transcript_14284/m.31278 type:complete len:519 (-) Transcript_14284:243-1799(-)